MSALPTPPACAGGQLYTVVRGDTLFSLSKRFGTTVDAIRTANPQLTNPNVLVIGQQLCIPAAPAPEPGPSPSPFPLPPACPEGILHVVKPGDTIFGLANFYGILASRIIAANPQVPDPNVLSPGQTLCIPTPAIGAPSTPPPPPACVGGTLVTVQPGESMGVIANRYGVGLQALIAANPQVPDPRFILPGQQLCVPGVTPGPAPGCPGGIVHVVAPGETLFAIAGGSKLTVQQLLAANPQITDPNVLTVGQTICIPPPTRS
ncbi:MAG: LysM peptidoglycan-binding domain-containing protein [Chitinophagales bacterium]